MKRLNILLIFIASCFLVSSCELFIVNFFGIEHITIINDTQYDFVIGETETFGDTLCVGIFEYCYNRVNSGDTLEFRHLSDFGIDRLLRPKEGAEPPVFELIIAFPEIDYEIRRKPEEDYSDPNIYGIIRVTLADLEACNYIIAINETLSSGEFYTDNQHLSGSLCCCALKKN